MLAVAVVVIPRRTRCAWIAVPCARFIRQQKGVRVTDAFLRLLAGGAVCRAAQSSHADTEPGADLTIPTPVCNKTRS